MASSRLDVVASTFQSESEALHQKFIAITSDAACTGCQSAGYGEAILTAHLQTKWIEFTRSLVIASALGTRRTGGNSVRAIAGVKSLSDAERIVKDATILAARNAGFTSAVWHAPRFVIEVGALIKLKKLTTLTAAMGPTLTPEQITDFRNYLVHPGEKTRRKYEVLQAKLGMHYMEPEDLPHQHQRPGLPVFTWWVRELQRIAYDSTR